MVLTCAHRFCWGCLLAQGTAVKSRDARGWADGKDAKQQQQQEASGSATVALPPAEQAAQQQAAQAAVWEAEHPDEEAPATCAFDCAVCRKAQVLNLDRLQVDPHLDAFLQKLERQQRRGSGGGVTLRASAAAPPPSSSRPIPIGGAPAAAAQGGMAESMVLDAKPPSSAATTSLAEASELAEAAAAKQEEEAEAAAAQHAAQHAHRATQHAQHAQHVTVPRPQVVVESPFLGGAPGEPALLPPQRPEHAGRLVVCLDLDGTLVTTFTPKRAPMLPPSAVSYIVGKGGKLNPGGVFVVERPGLGEFLQRIAPFSEVRRRRGARPAMHGLAPGGPARRVISSASHCSCRGVTQQSDYCCHCRVHASCVRGPRLVHL